MLHDLRLISKIQIDFSMTKKLPDIEMLNPNFAQTLNLGQTSNPSSKRNNSTDKQLKSKIKRTYYPAVFEAPNIDDLKSTCDRMVINLLLNSGLIKTYF